MKKLLSGLVLLLGLSVSVNAYEAVPVVNGLMTIDFPADLSKLTESKISARYADKKLVPQEVYVNDEEGVSFAFNYIPMAVDKNSMRKVHQSFSQLLHAQHPNAKWKKDKLNSGLGSKIAKFEFENSGKNGKEYYIIYAFPVNGQLMLVTFISTDKDYYKKWVEIARAAYDSIVIL